MLPKKNEIHMQCFHFMNGHSLNCNRLAQPLKCNKSATTTNRTLTSTMFSINNRNEMKKKNRNWIKRYDDHEFRKANERYRHIDICCWWQSHKNCHDYINCCNNKLKRIIKWEKKYAWRQVENCICDITISDWWIMKQKVQNVNDNVTCLAAYGNDLSTPIIIAK